MDENYEECYKAVRKFEGSNDDDPRDPGGRTSRGIIQREWDKYRQGNPTLPADVWKASEADIAAIYRHDYWLTQFCQRLLSGLDETIFDYGVNSGVNRAPKVLRRCLHMPDDAPSADVQARLDQLAPVERRTLIHAVNDERLAFLQGLKTWPVFGKGWGRRVAQVKSISLHLHDNPAGTVAPKLPEIADKTPKGQHPEPKGSKKAATTTGVAAAGGSLFQWLQTHPVEAVILVAVIAAAVVFVLRAIDKNHKKKQEGPPPGWVPPASLKPKAAP
jgi:lysozyme family protein